MSANTETTGADRAKCKAWCGTYKLHESGIQRYWSTELSCMGDGAPTHWCSRECRDARLPPIAAPAAHVERRKGQRWLVKRDDQLAYEATLDARDCDGWFTVSSRGGGWIHDDCWKLPAYTMTLLADAPPEPAKACESCSGDESTCGVHGCPGGKIKTCPTCEWAMSDCACTPPAQEAPKAAPVCTGQGKLHQGAALERYVKNIGTGYVEYRLLCDACHLWREKQFIELTAPRSAGKPYAGPERLPRPQLAADWVEDCLGDVR